MLIQPNFQSVPKTLFAGYPLCAANEGCSSWRPFIYISPFPQFQCHRCIAGVEHFNCSACSYIFRPLNGICSLGNFVYFIPRLLLLPIPNGHSECPIMLHEQSFPCRARYGLIKPYCATVIGYAKIFWCYNFKDSSSLNAHLVEKVLKIREKWQNKSRFSCFIDWNFIY